MVVLAVDNRSAFQGIRDTIIGRCGAMRCVFELAQRVAAVDSTLLIQGETGTGKGLLARAIHAASPRGKGPFVTLNCGAIPETLLESELFSHVRGAFTGATATKTGKFALAAGGTIFLDEIGDMSLDLQVKLLRVLEEGEFEPVGGERTQRTDVRVIAATHRDLEAAVAEGRFRDDLYYRICIIPIALPPLRERGQDIELLMTHFVERFREPMAVGPLAFSAEALALLRRHRWPGNIRELRNLSERLVVLKGEGEVRAEDLPVSMRENGAGGSGDPLPVELGDDGVCLNTAVGEYEKLLILRSLEKANGVKNQAAKLLHLNRTTLVEKIKRYGI
jgi:transcriptional regulator with GAF, ATPase, and Fis domain